MFETHCEIASVVSLHRSDIKSNLECVNPEIARLKRKVGHCLPRRRHIYSVAKTGAGLKQGIPEPTLRLAKLSKLDN